MSRGAQKRRDLAVRVALGAGRARLATALLLEMLVVSAAAVTLALGLTWLAGTSLQRILLPNATGGTDAVRLLGLAAGTTDIHLPGADRLPLDPRQTRPSTRSRPRSSAPWACRSCAVARSAPTIAPPRRP